MRVQFQLLIFIICLNLATGMVMALTLPGTAYTTAIEGTPGGNITDYEERFNATEISTEWKPGGVLDYIPLIGDLLSGFYFFVTDILPFMLDGFPMLLTWIANTYIAERDVASYSAFTVIANVLRAVYAVMLAIFVIEFISGRRLPD